MIHTLSSGPADETGTIDGLLDSVHALVGQTGEQVRHKALTLLTNIYAMGHPNETQQNRFDTLWTAHGGPNSGSGDSMQPHESVSPSVDTAANGHAPVIPQRSGNSGGMHPLHKAVRVSKPAPVPVYPASRPVIRTPEAKLLVPKETMNREFQKRRLRTFQTFDITKVPLFHRMPEACRVDVVRRWAEELGKQPTVATVEGAIHRVLLPLMGLTQQQTELRDIVADLIRELWYQGVIGLDDVRTLIHQA